MNYKLGNLIVLGLGGSVVFQNEIDVKLLKDWKLLVEKYSKTHKFIIVMGGGKLARRFQDAAKSIKPISIKESDWLGIYATRANAKLIQTIFGKIADPVLFDEPKKIKKLTNKVTVACGWEPGASTDYVCMVLAEQFGAGAVVMAGRPAFIYDKNPDQFIDARPFKEMKWTEYWKLVPHKWEPGANLPIDPVAAKFGKAKKIATIVLDGRNMMNMENLLKGEEFDGTIVH